MLKIFEKVVGFFNDIFLSEWGETDKTRWRVARTGAGFSFWVKETKWVDFHNKRIEWKPIISDVYVDGTIAHVSKTLPVGEEPTL